MPGTVSDPDEGYELYPRDDSAFHISGGGPADVVYGAYEFLRRFCGCQFSGLGEEGEYIPARKEIAITCEKIRRNPKLWYRGLQFSKRRNEAQMLNCDENWVYLDTHYYPHNKRMNVLFLDGHIESIAGTFGVTHPEFKRLPRPDYIVVKK